jgi:hypothetical protein
MTILPARRLVGSFFTAAVLLGGASLGCAINSAASGGGPSCDVPDCGQGGGPDGSRPDVASASRDGRVDERGDGAAKGSHDARASAHDGQHPADTSIPPDGSPPDTSVAVDSPTDSPGAFDIMTSCVGKADGTATASSEICCNGWPIPATSNEKCPALFYGSANGVNDAPIVGGAPSPTGRGYWLASQNGGVFSFGDAAFGGSITTSVNDIVGMAANPAGAGYWLVGADGGIFSFGGAPFGGSLPGESISVTNIVGMAANPSGSGYWVVGSTGTVYPLGGAPNDGSLAAGTVSNIVGMAANPTGPGYWLVGADGGVFALGGAAYSGSLPGDNVTVSNIVGITANPAGDGYWLVGSDGGVFTFGTTNYFAGSAHLYTSAPVVGMLGSPDIYGYWTFANDGEVFVAPDAPAESTATSPIGPSESFLGQEGLFEITVWDANGQRNCNEGPFAQIPGDSTHVIGRYNDTCTSTSPTIGPNWSLARWSIDWTHHELTFVNMIFDTRAGSVAISGGESVSTYYDATIVSYSGELWVAGECGGNIDAGTASACVGPLSTSTWTIDPTRTNVPVLGNESQNNGYLFSASVPKLLIFQSDLFVYWSAVKIDAENSQWANITERGTQLKEFPASDGMLWASRLGGVVGAADLTYTDEVWGLGSTTADDAVADIGSIFTDGTSVYAGGSISGTACSQPTWPPTCYSLAFAKSSNPLGNDIFNSGTMLPATTLPTNMGAEIRLFTDPSGINYLWGTYFTNVTGPRALAFTGSANAGYLLGYAVPPDTPFFESL